MSLNTMPIFVINLKQDIKKKEHMQKQAIQNNLEFTFINAIYGKDFSQDEIDTICKHEETRKLLKRELFRGEIGVALSQKSIYQKMVDENIQEAVIFEDDIIIDKNFYEAISSTKKFPLDWELVLLGYHRHFISNKFYRISFRHQKRITSHCKIVRFTDTMDGAFGYVISLTGAKKLLKILNQGLVRPVDHYTGDSQYINLYGIYPKCVAVDIGIGSSINEERHAYWESTKKEKNKNLSRKEKLKEKLDEYGILSFIQIINRAKHTIQDELKHFPKQLKFLPPYKTNKGE